MPDNDPYPNTGFGNTSTTTYPTGNRTNESLRDRVSDMTHQARERANEFGRKSADSIDRNIDAAAGKLQDTAEQLRTKAGPSDDRMSQFATTAADKLDATARYFREHHTRDMVSGVEHAVRRNPGASMCAALALGFLLGMAMKKDRYS